MDKVKYVRLEQQDGSYSNPIPLVADGNYVDIDGENVITKLNKKPYYYDTVADMKADTKLKVGDVAITLGYYEINDNGGARYKIVNNINQNNYQEEINENLYATLIINDYVTPEMFGAIGNGIANDTEAFQKALDVSKKIKAYKKYLLRDLFINNGNEIYFSPNSVVYRDKTDNINNAGLFIANGTIEDNIYSLTVEANENSFNLQLNSVVGLNVGDTIIIKYPGLENTANENKMLVSKIINIDNNNVTIANPLQWNYIVGSTIQKINPIKFKINGNGMDF